MYTKRNTHTDDGGRGSHAYEKNNKRAEEKQSTCRRKQKTHTDEKTNTDENNVYRHMKKKTKKACRWDNN